MTFLNNFSVHLSLSVQLPCYCSPITEGPVVPRSLSLHTQPVQDGDPGAQTLQVLAGVSKAMGVTQLTGGGRGSHR